jgi:hypothetical protein
MHESESEDGVQLLSDDLESESGKLPRPVASHGLDPIGSGRCMRGGHELGNSLLGSCKVSKLSRPTDLSHQGLDPTGSELGGRTTHELDNEFLDKYSDIAGKRTFSAMFGETRGTG